MIPTTPTNVPSAMAEKPTAILHPNQTMNTITNRNTRDIHRGLPIVKMITMLEGEGGRTAILFLDRRKRSCIGIMMMWIMIPIVVGGKEVRIDYSIRIIMG